MKIKTQNGFTLSETLITVAILGIIAALVIPNIISHYKERVTVVKLKKVYAELQRAYDLAWINYGEVQNWHTYLCQEDTLNLFSNSVTLAKCNAYKANYENDNNSTVLPFSKFLSLGSKKCPTSSSVSASKCYVDASNVTYLKGGSVSSYYTYGTQAYLKDGTFIIMRNNYPAYNGEYCALGDNGKCADLTVDINGVKKPNQFGRDIFIFELRKKGIYPRGGDTDHINYCANTKKEGISCARWVIERGNMDYLRKTTSW